MQAKSAPNGNHLAYYPILDGLRGIAALGVLFFHLMEAFSLGNPLEQIFNHGYLAVDFFFLLSGFVIAHTYDSRWGKMNRKEFLLRRLARLHPMAVWGMCLGLVAFYSGESSLFPLIEKTPFSHLILVFIWGCTLLPLPVSFDVRGWGEMHPLNGPAWSLFFEYLANFLYAMVLRRISVVILALLTLFSAGALLEQTLLEPRGDVVGGWSLEPGQFRIGLVRLAFPFLCGMLLKRAFKPISLPKPLWLSACLLLLILATPRIGGSEQTWQNGLFESYAILIAFPFILLIATGNQTISDQEEKVCHFLGGISYPLYITHYPAIYLLSAWTFENQIPLQQGWPVAMGTGLSCLIVALLSHFYLDLPIRKILVRKWEIKS